MTDMDSIITVVVGSITAMGGLLCAATMMEQWMKHEPVAARADGAATLVGAEAE